jgi:hypothetical protein
MYFFTDLCNYVLHSANILVLIEVKKNVDDIRRPSLIGGSGGKTTRILDLGNIVK